MQPSFHNWACWIGSASRKLDTWNTEYEKVNLTKNNPSGKSVDQLSDEYLQDLLYTKDVSDNVKYILMTCTQRYQACQMDQFQCCNSCMMSSIYYIIEHVCVCGFGCVCPPI